MLPFGVGKKGFGAAYRLVGPLRRIKPQAPWPPSSVMKGKWLCPEKRTLKAVWSEAAGLKEVLPTKNGGPPAPPAPATFMKFVAQAGAPSRADFARARVETLRASLAAGPSRATCTLNNYLDRYLHSRGQSRAFQSLWVLPTPQHYLVFATRGSFRPKLARETDF